MALPFLPGNNFTQNLGRDKFHKSHAFDYNGDVYNFVGEHKSGIGGQPLPGGKPKPKASVYPKGIGSNKPAWVAFDRQVLKFDAYFQEAVHERREERYRIRKCIIYFYLEDDTIQVLEPKQENSGIPQGTLVRRHRIPLPAPNDDQFYTVEHFNVGNEISLYSRTFKIMGCDKFTQNFLSKLGVRVKSSENFPEDPFATYRSQQLATMQPLRPYERIDTLKQFLEHDRQVLRFYCVWDDSHNMFGDPHVLVLHYFLANDTIEIIEKVAPNSGRDAFPVFLQRQKLPKQVETLKQPGVETKRTVLNVFGPMGYGGRHILDSLKTGAINTENYNDVDLTLGGVINVWGRKVLICDCDEFTKQYYKSKYGIEQFNKVEIKQPTPSATKRDYPPFEGFQIGSEEDTLANCIDLIPKPPRKDFIKFMRKDRQGLNSNVLRFVAKLDTTRPIDIDRTFIIFFYLSDDTIAVFERPQRNSGIIAGSFLERNRIVKSKTQDATIYYQAEDFYVGGRVEFNKHKFVLIDADEYVFKYMEKYCEQFPHSNINLIMAKLRGPAIPRIQDIREKFAKHDPEKLGILPYVKFRSLVIQLSEGLLNEHEIMTLGRNYGDQKPFPSVIKLAQSDLEKQNYTSFTKLQEMLEYHDSDKTGLLSADNIKHICHVAQLPLSDQFIDGVMMACQDKDSVVHYNDFLRFMNWKDHPLNLPQPPAHDMPAAGKSDGADNSQDTSMVTQVHYGKLLTELVQ